MHLAVAVRRDDATVIPGDWVRKAQDFRSMSSAGLARRLEVDNTTIYRWREEKAPVTKVIWLAVLSALDLPHDWQPEPPAKPSTRAKAPR